jgi:type IV pilus assembly protein PilO
MASRPQVSALGRLSLSAKFVVGLVMLSIVAAVYFVVFFAEIDGQVSQAIAEEQNLRGELQKAEEAKVAYQKDVEDKTRRQQLEREQRKVLPDESETPSFLAAVQNVATTSGVSLTSYKPQDEVAEEYFVRVPMSLSVAGRFHQVARFFFGIGQLDRVINIEDIDMKTELDKSGTTILRVDCLATAFRAKRTNEVAKKGGRK